MPPKSTDSPPPEIDAVRNILRQVADPELGANIVDLGLVYRIEAAADHVLIEMTMTSPACPMGDMIVDEVRDVLAAALPEHCRPEVRLVWEPPWDPSMMSERIKAHFGW
ncbi:MAG: hypothetical protein H6R10_3468 [Rhodocyclaceae bacterium]|nr:hypothetical protein [Rhodocyclaceae bacterium]